jgi:hypothetical protein
MATISLDETSHAQDGVRPAGSIAEVALAARAAVVF